MRYENEVVFTYGFTITPEQMEENTIYLDGAAAGPVLDPAHRAYSFDHHTHSIRFSTLSTSEQVLLALDMGLDPKGLRVVVNDLDADTSMSLWLLFNPHKVDDRVREQVRLIGRVDSHGPLWAPTKLHKALSRKPGVVQTFEDLLADQQKIDDWYEYGDDGLPAPFALPPCQMHGLDRDGEVIEVMGDFAAAYAAGAVIAIAKVPGPGGTIGWTVGKRSDFARGDISGFLDEMSSLEPGWGGGSTIGGAPRNPDGTRSRLTFTEVWPIFLKHAR